MKLVSIWRKASLWLPLAAGGLLVSLTSPLAADEPAEQSSPATVRAIWSTEDAEFVLQPGPGRGPGGPPRGERDDDDNDDDDNEDRRDAGRGDDDDAPGRRDVAPPRGGPGRPPSARGGSSGGRGNI